MKSFESKYQFSWRVALVYAFLSALLLTTNTTGWNNIFYKKMDTTVNPFFIITRKAALNVSMFMDESFHKSNVLKENINLKRELLKYDEIKAKNLELTEKLKILESQTKITTQGDKEFNLFEIIGVQNLSSDDRELLISLNRNDLNIKEDMPVYYEKNTLFGFVSAINGKTAKVIPYYSSEAKSKIPVQNLRDTTQKGFISGIEKDTVRIKNVPRDYKVDVGDVWATTNDVVEVPANLIVGKVKNIVSDQQEGSREIELELPFSLSYLSYVMIEKQ